jgi:prepilin-type N-terminal cleavage/methylation domain-containing protein
VERSGPESCVGPMDFRFRGNGRPRTAGFTLLEVLAALAILGLASSSVLLVIDRCVASAADSALRMEAFELARENLEKILVRDAVAETVEFGTSDQYSDVSWQTVVEAFPEPAGGQMWLRAVCSAQYIDSTGETRTVELVHWITELTDQQAGQLVGQKDLDKLGVEQLMKTDEEAATYANVNTDTIRRWVENGLVKTQDDLFLRYNLDVFIRSKGDPTPEQKAEQVETIQELAMKLRTQQKELEQNGALGMPLGAGGTDGAAGLSNQAFEKRSPGQTMSQGNQR